MKQSMSRDQSSANPTLRLIGEDLRAKVRLYWDRLVKAFETLLVPFLLIGSVTLIALTVIRFFAWRTMANTVSVPKDRIAAENQMYATVAQIFGGAFVLTGLYFTGKNYLASRQADATERLAKAVERLASPDLTAKTGAILTLAGVLHRQTVDYMPIAKLLCAYVQDATGDEHYQQEFSNKPRADVQIAIETLGRRRRSFRRGESRALDISGSFLSGADFSRSDFRGFNFADCRLERTRFYRVHAEWASFLRAEASECDLRQADLRRTSFYAANLAGAKFRRALVVRSNFTRSDLRRASFDETRISRASFGSAQLEGATFADCHLLRCNFARVSRSSVNFDNAQIRHAEGFIA